MNERQDGLQEIIDATLREMAAEGAKGSTHWQFSPRCKLTICAESLPKGRAPIYQSHYFYDYSDQGRETQSGKNELYTSN